MTVRLGTAVALVAMVVGAVPPSAASARDDDAPFVDVQGRGDGFDSMGVAGSTAPVARGAAETSAARERVEYERLANRLCSVGGGGALAAACANPDVGEVTCEEGEMRLDPLFRRVWSDGVWSEWELVEGPSCAVDGQALSAAVEREFKRLKVARPVLHVQPAVSALVNKPVIVFADASPQVFEVELLGQAVELEASPVGFSWDFGDGSAPVSTTSAGHGYPDQDVTHTYAHAGGVRVAVTASWSGRFRLRGAAEWTAIEGEVSTSSEVVGLEVVEARTHLVEDTTD